MTMYWADAEALIMGLPNYYHHVITAIHLDGCTLEVKIYFTDGSTKTFMAYTQNDITGRIVLKYKQLIL